MIKRGLNKKVKWSCSMRVNLVTEELMERMKTAGCYYIFYGFESANDKTLKTIRKGITTSKMLNAVKELIANFNDSCVGAVSGELFLRPEKQDDVGGSFGLYWKYEKLIRKLDLLTRARRLM